MLGSIISAGAQLFGGLLGKKSADKANEANIKNQRDFAQNSIQWRVADAQKAGVHPVYALGAPTMSFAPSSVGDTSLPAALSGMGQDLGRAVNAGRSSQSRYDVLVQTLTLKRMGLENDLLASQIAKINQVGSAPPFPDQAAGGHLIPGQGDAPILSPAQVTVGHRGGFNSSVDAQSFEDRYGEGGGDWIQGPKNMIRDASPALFNALRTIYRVLDAPITPRSYGGRDVTGGMPY